MILTLVQGRPDHHDDRRHQSDVVVAHGRTARIPTPRPAATPSGSGWYHDAAIEAVRQQTIEATSKPYR